MSENLNISGGVSVIRGRIRQVRAHYKNVTTAECAGLIAAALLPVLGLLFVMDNVFHLPMVLRMFFFIALTAGVVHIIRRTARKMRQGATDEELALRVEKAFPDLNNELINSLLLAKEAGEEAGQLVAEVVKEGSRDSGKINLSRAIPKKKLKVFMGAATVASIIMALYAAAFPAYFFNACQRVLFPVMPVAPITLTHIDEVAPASCDVLSGQDVNVTVKLNGVIKPAEIGYRIAEGERKVARMAKDRSDETTFGYRIRQLTQDTAYYVKAGDAKTETFTITVHERPVIKDIKATLTYPAYSGLAEVVQNKLAIKALQGTAVNIAATASKPLESATITFAGGKPEKINVSGNVNISTRFVMDKDQTYEIGLLDAFGFQNEPVSYDAEILIDHAPSIDLIEPAHTVMVSENDIVTFDFTAADDYGIRKVELLQMPDKSEKGKKPGILPKADNRQVPDKSEKGELQNEPPKDRVIKEWTPDNKFVKEFSQRYELPVRELNTEAGKTATVYLRAEDWNDVSGPGVGQTMIISISIASKDTAKKDGEEKIKKAAATLAGIIHLQERNLRDSKALWRKNTPEGGYTVDAMPLKKLVDVQEEIRKLTGTVKALLKADNPIRTTLDSLCNSEMITAVKQLRAVEQNFMSLDAAIGTESDILARLTARNKRLAGSINRKNMQDIFAELDAIIAAEKEIRDATKGHIDGNQWNKAREAGRQDALTDRFAQFKEKLIAHAHEVAQSDVELGKRFEGVVAELDAKQIRQDMFRAAGAIDKNKAKDALVIEERIIANLEEIKKMLREQLAEHAEAKLEQLKKVIAKASEKAKKLANLERKVKQISDELKPPNDLTEDANEEIKKKVEEMDKIKESMAEVIEKMAKDLHLFPDIPAANELVQKMREVYEDIEQKEGSEDAEAVEVAVERGETEGQKAAKDSMEDMVERIADMEMWLSDAPDNIKWKQESLDVDEIPDIPLVDLPEELEDLVGDLLDQEQDIGDKEDSASNLGSHDMPAGWDVADGPMPNFGAKGKSGNTKPNDMEQMGRSGGGRQGKSSGEMVEEFAKDLEGADVEVRRTNGPMQKGEVEEENPNSEAKATGGGKQSGQGGEGGLTGSSAPQNELGMRELERQQMDLRRNTEKLYSQAIMMYLPTGELDNALLLMQQAQKAAAEGDRFGFTSLQRRIVRALDNTQRELRGEAKVALDPSMKLPADMLEEVSDARDEEIPKEFETLVSEYYKAIAGALAE